MRLDVAEVLVRADRREREAREAVLREVPERRDREGVAVDEDQHVVGLGPRGDQVGEGVQLLRVRKRAEVGDDVEALRVPRVDPLEVGPHLVRPVDVAPQLLELDVDPAIAHPVHRREVDHLGVTIYYRCPDKDYPVGGIRVIYRHVDLLNRNGFNAAVLHRLHPFRCTWFENETRVAHEVRYPDRSPAARAWRAARRAQVDPLPALELGGADVLVLPEVMPDVPEAEAHVPKAVFNQNAYLTFAPYALDADPRSLVYARPEVAGVIVVSEDNCAYLEALFPELRVRRVHYGIDPELFAFEPEKKRQLAYMPRKNARDLQQVLLRLRLAGSLDGWDAVEIA